MFRTTPPPPQVLQSQYRRYVESGVWRCPGGGAHHWVCTNGNKWQCIKCENTKTVTCPEYGEFVWSDRLDGNYGTFGIKGTFAASLRLRV